MKTKGLTKRQIEVERKRREKAGAEHREQVIAGYMVAIEGADLGKMEDDLRHRIYVHHACGDYTECQRLAEMLYVVRELIK